MNYVLHMERRLTDMIRCGAVGGRLKIGGLLILRGIEARTVQCTCIVPVGYGEERGRS